MSTREAGEFFIRPIQISSFAKALQITNDCMESTVQSFVHIVIQTILYGTDGNNWCMLCGSLQSCRASSMVPFLIQKEQNPRLQARISSLIAQVMLDYEFLTFDQIIYIDISFGQVPLHRKTLLEQERRQRRMEYAQSFFKEDEIHESSSRKYFGWVYDTVASFSPSSLQHSSLHQNDPKAMSVPANATKSLQNKQRVKNLLQKMEDMESIWQKKWYEKKLLECLQMDDFFTIHECCSLEAFLKKEFELQQEEDNELLQPNDVEGIWTYGIGKFKETVKTMDNFDEIFGMDHVDPCVSNKNNKDEEMIVRYIDAIQKTCKKIVDLVVQYEPIEHSCQKDKWSWTFSTRIVDLEKFSITKKNKASESEKILRETKPITIGNVGKQLFQEVLLTGSRGFL